MDEDDGVRGNTVTHSPTNSQQTGNEFRLPKVFAAFPFSFPFFFMLPSTENAKRWS